MYILCFIGIVSALSLMGIALLIRQVIDKATKNGDIFWYSLILVGIVLFQIILRGIYQIVRNSYSLELDLKLKKEVYVKFTNKKITEISKIHSGELSNLYLNDIRNINEGLSIAIPNICTQIAQFIFSLIAIIIIDWRFLIALLVIGVLALLFGRIYGKKMKKVQKTALSSDGALTSFMQESVENIRLIKANSSEKSAIKSLDEIMKENRIIKKKKNQISIIGITGINSVMQLSYILALIYGAYSIINYGMSYGTFVALLQFVTYIESPFTMVSAQINRVYAYKASKERIEQIDELENEEENEEINDFSSIVFENVTFAYDKPIYENFNLEINKGTIVCLKGPSGIGKTTLFNLLLGFIRPQNGRVYIKNGEIEYIASKGTRRLFSYVPQDNLLFSGTILENIRFFSENSSIDEINEALKVACIYDDIMELPKKLDQPLVERGIGLSTGQIQRILIAISILRNCPIMLLDEFTSALDFKHEEDIVNNIKALGKTIIMITHRDIDTTNIKEVRIG